MIHRLCMHIWATCLLPSSCWKWRTKAPASYKSSTTNYIKHLACIGYFAFLLRLMQVPLDLDLLPLIASKQIQSTLLLTAHCIQNSNAGSSRKKLELLKPTTICTSTKHYYCAIVLGGGRVEYSFEVIAIHWDIKTPTWSLNFRKL
jgi:hypothetical protein